MNLKDIAVVIPVYNDWASLHTLLTELDKMNAGRFRLSVFCVDDGSNESGPKNFNDLAGGGFQKLEILSLSCNMGHQRAIAAGLMEIRKRGEKYEAVIVMDSDGEDTPADFFRLIETHRENPERLIVAERTKRSESLSFKLFYQVYKFIFRLLTGRSISFGNFMLVPQHFLDSLLCSGFLERHIAAAVVRAKIPLYKMPSNRGRRYLGESKMNTVALVLHGMSAISVFSDTLLTRILMLSVLLSVASISGLLTVVFMRVFTDMAIPGWASYMFIGFLMVLFQAMVLFIVGLILLLNSNKDALRSSDNIPLIRERMSIL